MSHNADYNKLINCKRWREIRNEFLTQHPLCQRCGDKTSRAAMCVHHITPVESARTIDDMAALAYNPTNLQALCYECHADIHKGGRSHSKDVHKQRANESLQRWIERHQNKQVLGQNLKDDERDRRD